VTIRWFTDADRAEQARIRREQRERGELMLTYGRWLMDRAGHDGPVTAPDLTPETEERLLRLLREQAEAPAEDGPGSRGNDAAGR
jgi:hypothetical protein